MIQIKMGNGPTHYAIDVSAIHKYISNEFNDLYNSGHYKTELSADDLILLEDSDDGYSKKVIQAININSAIIDETAIHKNRMNEINSIEYTKDQLEENDIFVIEDSYQDPITLNQWEKRKITVSAINIDLISDGVTYKKFTTIEQTKLQGIEEGADVTDIDNVTLAENSINVSSHADITSPGADIEDAVTKRHVQGTDTTLGQQVQNIDLNNNIIKNSGLPIDDNDLISKLFLKSSSPMFLEPNQYLQHGLAIKDTLVYGDLFLIEDSEDGYNKKLSSFANFTFDPLAIHVNRFGEINGCDLLVEPIEWDDVLLIEDKSEVFSKKRVQFQRIVTSSNNNRVQFACETGDASLIVPSSGTLLTSADISTLNLVQLTETTNLHDTCYGNYYLCETTGSIIVTLPKINLNTKGKQVGFIYNKYSSYNLSHVLIKTDTGDIINNGKTSILLNASESMIFVNDGIDHWSIINLQTDTTIHINKPKEIDLLTFDTPTTSDILLFENSHNPAEMWSKNKMEIGHITMDILSDGTEYVRMSAEEKTHLHTQGTDITLGIQSQNSDWGGYRITNAGVPIDDNDYTTKYYVDDTTQYYVDNSATSKTENYFKNFVDIYSNTLSNYNNFYTSNLDLLYNDNIIIYDILVSPNGTIFACGLDTITSFACYIYKKPYETQFTRMVYLASPNDLFGIPIKISCSPNGVINIINVCPSSLLKKSLNTTQDYPNIWYTSSLPYIDTGTKKNSLSDMIFHNEDKIFALSSDGVPEGNARIYKNDTEVFLSPFYDSEIKSFCEISSNEIIASYNHSTTIYNILYSNNAGNTWSIRSNIAYKFNKIIKTDQDTIIGILDHEIYKSIDNGVTFIPTPILAVPNSTLKDIIYIGNGILIAAGNNISTSGIYFISYDFGNSWNVYQLSTNGAGPYDKIYFDSATMTMYLINTTGGALFKGLFSKGFQNKILRDNFAIHLNGANEISSLPLVAPSENDILLIEQPMISHPEKYTKQCILLSSISNFGYKSYMMPCEYSADLGARRVRSVGSTQRFNFHIPYDFKDFGGTGGVFVCGFPSSGAAQPGRIVEVTIDHDTGPGTAYNNISTFNTVTYDLTGYTDSLWMLPIASYMNPSAGITGGIYLNHTLLGGLIRYIGTMVIYK